MTFANSSLVADKSQLTNGCDDGATTRLLPRLAAQLRASSIGEVLPRNRLGELDVARTS